MAPRRISFGLSLLIGAIFPAFSFAAAPASEAQKAAPVRIDVGGYKLNSLLIEPQKQADLPPIVFLHGASASLYDPLFSFADKLAGRARLLFIDRPGHGGSDIGGKENILPDGQADAVAQLMRKRGIHKAIIVGHSFGGAITAAFALRHPEMVSGLVFLSPAVYPWPGGIAWYYTAASAPVTGPLFSTFVAPPAGLLALDQATRGVFAPNNRPREYVEATRAWAALRPQAFRHNAQEVAALNAWARSASPSYSKIKAPTIIITGDTDNVVSPEIHSRQLARTIDGSTLIVVKNLGHKSDYVARDLVVEAIEKLAGKKADLHAAQKQLERRIASDGK
ncbi:alpha/beta hydrolase [Agrobacterium salinitolerans]|uniref:Alpha/beta hydrolase n=1 Tax=Agrobacterium salinitolerans TaxID=1183413 RepID=A0ABY3BLZ6_9HYPH|nr:MULTISPECIES: alpha/beta hydrolase [Agrobacterium]MCZ7859050.1 alpha/beta hydrolase [Agrobacterium salinitolerans]MCZ7892106.1 alpha/beta hydrolase [Agrobacterium salinitolerans]TRA87735.1 alpha/beta hydrolase [Agrobacterium salinitolerans]